MGGARWLLTGLLTACASRGSPIPDQQNPGAPGTQVQSMDRRVVRNVAGKYQLFLPREYGSRTERWPLILFLHGGGERGDDIERVKVHGPLKVAAQRPDFPFIVVAPQVATDMIWSTARLDALLEEVQEKYRVDLDRIYVTGLSMGGYGTWHLAMEYPHRFAGIAPISGGATPSGMCALKHLPIWVFHGAKDDVIKLDRSEELVERLKRCSGNVRFTVYPDVGHDAWTQTYENPELYAWFLQQRRR